MRPIQYPLLESQELSGLLPPIPIREFKGVNTYDPLSIPDNYFTDMSNMTTDDYPSLSVRPGYSVLGSAIGTKVLGLATWQDKELHAVFNDGTWRKWSGSAWTTLASGLSTTAEWSFTNFDGNLGTPNLIGANGVDPIKRYNGTSVSNLSGAPTGGNYIATYQNRLWCAVGLEIRACALDNPTSWTDYSLNDSASYAKTMESTRGENVNMLSGSLSKLTIGMPGSLHELYGSLPRNFNTRLVTELQGVVNNKSAITAGGVMRFIHQTGLYEYGGASLPDREFSDIVEGLLTGISTSSMVGTDGKKFYFRIGSRILVWDMRSGVRSWTIWNNISAAQMVVFQNELYIGDEQGRVLKLGGTTDAGTPITAYAVSRPFTNMSMAQRMRWYKLWSGVELNTGSTFNLYLSPSVSGNDWELAQTITGSGVQVRRAINPPSKFALENWIRVKFEFIGPGKLHEFTRQQRALPLT